MPTWEEARAYLGGRYRLVWTEADWVGMEWPSTSDGDAAPLRLKLERVSVFAAPWLLLRCALCDEGAVDPRSALRYNARLAIGSVALEDGRCYLRAALPLHELTWPHLDRTIAFLAEEAAHLRQREDPHPSTPVFGAWAD